MPAHRHNIRGKHGPDCVTCPAQSATFLAMALRNNDWLAFCDICHVAAKTSSGVFFRHGSDTTERIALCNHNTTGPCIVAGHMMCGSVLLPDQNAALTPIGMKKGPAHAEPGFILRLRVGLRPRPRPFRPWAWACVWARVWAWACFQASQPDHFPHQLARRRVPDPAVARRPDP